MVQLLTNAGADVNVNPKAALCRAVYDSEGEITQILIDAGADVDAECEGYTGGTPLGIAVYWGKEEMVQTLIDAGARE